MGWSAGFRKAGLTIVYHMVYKEFMKTGSEAVIVVDWNADEPVYAQIARQIRARIAGGELPPGTVLPPVRAVASDLGVNLNTVARAYRLLEEEGFVSIRGRGGAVVAAPAREADGERIAGLSDELDILITRLYQAGLSPAEVRRRVEQVIAGMNTRGAKK